ncbi:hypothetical protein PPL_08243 [Heterostelium album PN500]|uniref:Uncharacterized protein n=1 Tax=Heterostelium pallidum (strain ATCC 26659 / Pp 5 / PN500) TaxID=670386 RepID=D3BJ06_HETP5|nr:hypothetical protein PPL_08243 [Heterostelium album PN500]EFA78780.1 hypothetical protein PPL_08243 [Heterostelium album PN500]|eukprot:XP_020430904.1 hypothetical protein PPL_08243 [Heterostelium album PN500]
MGEEKVSLLEEEKKPVTYQSPPPAYQYQGQQQPPVYYNQGYPPQQQGYPSQAYPPQQQGYPAQQYQPQYATVDISAHHQITCKSERDYNHMLVIFLVGFCFSIVWIGGFWYLKSPNKTARTLAIISIVLFFVGLIISIILLGIIFGTKMLFREFIWTVCLLVQ